MKQLIIACLLAVAILIFAQSELTVVASELAPCAMQNESEWIGFSIELWEEIAQELDWEYTLLAQHIPTILSQVETNAADVGIGCISVNFEREQR